ncbi:MAG: hypothetical protein KGJ10_01830 [Acidobacteriota bacterium]|nr:hypothetical protein [Acidobacteriota bacterium]MDE3043550.1 hypothetical protein [Acidobacteriota bacterium]MDE3106899.1 hypothetical protein [Acidobacteriota bacterium]MDE3222556.1 hypothetical protein [Acidobacteriota bacterium]
MKRSFGRLFLASLCAGVLGIFPAAAAHSATPSSTPAARLATGRAPLLLTGARSTSVCAGTPVAGQARCDAVIRRDRLARSLVPKPGSVATPAGLLGDNGAYSPAFLRSAYNAANLGASSNFGAGRVVGVVDAYDNPNLLSDLNYYRTYFGMSPCVSGTVSPLNTTCVLQQVNQGGQSAPLPSVNQSWGFEEAMDVEMVSALCVNCQILVVEARSSAMSDLGASVNTAVRLGANVVSNSYGSSEYPSEVADATSFYTHPGVPILAAAGDSGYGVQFPAAAASVIAVGGTTLTQTSANGVRSASESVWSGTGAGCSLYVAKPSWQSDPGCARRSVNDVAAVADPNTGVWVYDQSSSSQMAIAGGTSVATAVVSALYALTAGSWPTSVSGAQLLYEDSSSLYRVTTGADANCQNYLCDASQSVAGYNGPTGEGTLGGSPNSAAAIAGLITVATSATGSAATSAVATPSGVVALPGNGAVTVSWTPVNSSLINVTGYLVSDGHGHTCSTVVGPRLVNACVISGLTNGVPVRFRVAAVAGATQGTFSVASSAVVPSPTTAVRQLSVGNGFGCALLTSQRVDCWGANADGQVGNGTFAYSSGVASVTGLRHVVSVATGNADACAVTASGAVFCWGDNDSGQLGNGASTSLATPTQVLGVAGATQVSVGASYACALLATGAVACWGANADGQLGVATTAASSNVVTVPGVSGATAVVASLNHTCALRDGGLVSCWGANTYGQLGAAAPSRTSTVSVVAGVTGVTQLSLGASDTCALLVEGAVWCWGYNGDGELGVSNVTSTSVPVEVPGLPAIAQISSGAYGTCATDASGSEWCWGSGVSNALKANTASGLNAPAIVTNIAGVTSFAASYGDQFSCATLVTGALACWGAGGQGASVLNRSATSSRDRATGTRVSSDHGNVKRHR